LKVESGEGVLGTTFTKSLVFLSVAKKLNYFAEHSTAIVVLALLEAS